MLTMRQFAAQHQPHQLLGRLAHAAEALSKGNHCEAKVCQMGYHHGGIPAVICYFPDIVLFGQVTHEPDYRIVIHHIALCGFDKVLPCPEVIVHMIPAHTEIQRFIRHPEVRQHLIRLIIFLRRKYQHQRGQVGCTGQVQSCIAGTTFQRPFIYGYCAGVPLFHGHPPHSLLRPLAQAQLPEYILLCRILLCRVAGGFQLFDVNGDTQRWIRFLPDFRVCPVSIHGCTVDNWIKSRVMLTAIQNILCFLVLLVADRMDVISGSRDDEHQWLFPGITRAFCQDIE